MFWKSATNDEQAQLRGAYSITRRLIVFNIVAALVILLTTISYLYYALVLSLEEEDRLYLIKKIQVVRSVLQASPDAAAEVQREIQLQGDFQFIRFYIRVLDEKGAVIAQTKNTAFSPAPDLFPEPFPADRLPETGKKMRLADGASCYLMSAWADDGNPGGRRWLIQAALDLSA